MVGWSGRRKSLTILAFILPTVLGILIFNVYPMVLNTYVSFTNRNKFKPNPDCSNGLNSFLAPTCWPMFREKAPVGLGQPYTLIDPIFKNYTDLFGTLFTSKAVLAILSIVACAIPLYVASKVDQRFDQQLTRPVSSSLVWLAGIALALFLAWVLNVAGAYGELLDTGDFMTTVLRTVLFVVLRVPLSFLVGLVLGLILSSANLPGRTLFRVILFVPWAASSVAILMALVWQFFFRDQGTLNQILLTLFSIKGPVWLNNPLYAFGIIVLVDVWFSYPFFMIAILGALAAIPNELYEAADVDGATFWDQLTGITLPLIRPAILPAIVLTSITAFQMFGTAWALTTGGPSVGAGKPGATEFVMVYAYKQIFQLQNYGRATAFAVIIFIFLFAATLYSLRVTRITKGAYE